MMEVFQELVSRVAPPELKSLPPSELVQYYVNAFSNVGSNFVQMKEFEDSIAMVAKEQLRFAEKMRKRISANREIVLKSIENEMDQDSVGKKKKKK